MKHRWFVAAIITISAAHVRAGDRLTFLPSLEIVEVDDNNLNYSSVNPLSDHVRRVTPAFGLRYESARSLAILAASVDAEQYARHESMNDNRAKEQTSLLVQYQAAPRLRVALTGAYRKTNTLADLNISSGLASSRIRAQEMNIGAMAAYRVSPRFTVTMQPSSSMTAIADGSTMRNQVQALILQEKVSARDLFNIHYEYWDTTFRGPISRTVITQFIVARWIRDFHDHNRLTLLAGPRITDGKRSLDFTGIVAHAWKIGSIALSAQRTAAVVAGYAGLAVSENAQVKFALTPNRRLTAYVIPTMFRTTADGLQGNVFRVGVGARYALTSVIDAEVAYKNDNQNGALDPLVPNARFTHSTLLLRIGMRWNDREDAR